MSLRTHITIADRGWILEKLAKEIAIRSNAVTYGTDLDPSADLQYYINYSCRHRRAGPVEIAFFTHSERDKNARKRYFDIAKDVEHSVCMSRHYADELKEAGIKDVTTITPGVDLDAFNPKVRIGVIGRTYHTGRKGEALVADVMDIPGIEWRFTGQGWPGPSTFIDERKMPDFYNDLDYVLVPALYEGGPMCVLEALACGKPVIASEVGWVDEYPHIAFENGNADSLRKVLTRLVDERLKLREAVAHRTWSAWGDAHLDLFEKVARQHGIITKSGKLNVAQKTEGDSTPPTNGMSAILLTHGGEGKTLGGPSVRVPRTAEELTRIGVRTILPDEVKNNFASSEIAHIFNVWPADSAFSTLSKAKAAGKTTVFSPIYLNLTHTDLFSRKVPALFASNPDDDRVLKLGMESILAECHRAAAGPIGEPFPGYHDRVRACVSIADHTIFLSEYEKACLEKLGAVPDSSSLVRNPVSAGRFASADPDLFREKYDLEDYILCVGRIEPRKNQLMLALAARRAGLPLVFIGHEGKPTYANYVRRAAGDKALFVSRVAPDDPLLASAFAGARTFSLPSWAEGAPLAALEAASAGTSLVLSNQSSEPEYFAEKAQYVHPADLDGLTEALLEAWNSPKSDAERAEQQAYMKDTFSWARYADNTRRAYEMALAHNSKTDVIPTPATHAEATQRPKIYVDLTTTWHHTGNPTGIARVEHHCYHSLLNICADRIQPIVWNSNTREFVQISIADSLGSTNMDTLAHLQRVGNARAITQEDLQAGSRLINFGGAWIRNSNYVACIRKLKQGADLNFTVFIHDLIQLQFKQYYPNDAWIDFANNVTALTESADDFIVNSETTRNDLRTFLNSNGQAFKAITRMRFGDMTSPDQVATPALSGSNAIVREYVNKPFVVYVSSLDLRKNHVLLVNVWRRLLETRGGRTPFLLLIGRNMWRGEEIAEMIGSEDGLSSRIRVLQDINDDELKWLYANAQFSVYPSLYEGWGLPVAESLSFGTPCIASNRSSIREIAPEFTELLDPYDFRAWVDKVSFFLDNPAALEIRRKEIKKGFRSVDWDESVSDMLSSIDGLPLKPVERPVLWNEAPLSTDEACENHALADFILTQNWGRRERAGQWSLGKVSKLRLPLYRAFDEDLIHIRIHLSAYTRPYASRRMIHLHAAGREVGGFAIARKSSLITFSVPASSVDWNSHGLGVLDVTFLMDDVFSPSDISDSSDQRQLGIMMHQIAVAGSLSALSRAMPNHKAPPALTEHQFREAAAQSPTSVVGSSLTLTKDKQKQLAAAASLLETPQVLQGDGLLSRVLRLTKGDRAILPLYRKMFGRTHDSLRRVITILSAKE